MEAESMAIRELDIEIKDGVATCKPMPLTVDGGDQVVWKNGLAVVYRPSPFMEGGGPFDATSKPSTIKKGVFTREQKFHAFVTIGGQEKPCKGQIIIRDP
jgi:hypothetical protein